MYTSQSRSFGKAVVALRNVLNYARRTNSPALELSCGGRKLWGMCALLSCHLPVVQIKSICS